MPAAQPAPRPSVSVVGPRYDEEAAVAEARRRFAAALDVVPGAESP